MWQVIKAGGEWRGIFHNRKKNGELFWESAVIRPSKIIRGPFHFLALKEDITEKLAMEGSAAAISKAGSHRPTRRRIAHEINTPIQYVSDNTSFLKTRGTSSPSADCGAEAA